jgi:hypothetical protein
VTCQASDTLPLRSSVCSFLMADIEHDVVHLSIAPLDGLTNSRRESIKAALKSYQLVVLERNLSNLRFIIAGLGSQSQARRDDMANLAKYYFRGGHRSD